MLPTAPAARQDDRRRPGTPRGDRLRSCLFATLYGPAARVYDPFTAWLFLGEWDRWRRTVLPLVPESGVIVELGAGTGALARIGACPGRSWLAIEPSRSMLSVARRRDRGNGIWWVRGTTAALPLPAGVADAVVATFPAPYILDAATAAEARRILKPAGPIVVVLSGELAAHGVRRRLRRLALRLFYGRSGDGPRDFGLRGFAGEVRPVVTRHGVASVYVGTPAPTVPARPVNPAGRDWG